MQCYLHLWWYFMCIVVVLLLLLAIKHCQRRCLANSLCAPPPPPFWVMSPNELWHHSTPPFVLSLLAHFHFLTFTLSLSHFNFSTFTQKSYDITSSRLLTFHYWPRFSADPQACFWAKWVGPGDVGLGSGLGWGGLWLNDARHYVLRFTLSWTWWCWEVVWIDIRLPCAGQGQGQGGGGGGGEGGG